MDLFQLLREEMAEAEAGRQLILRMAGVVSAALFAVFAFFAVHPPEFDIVFLCMLAGGAAFFLCISSPALHVVLKVMTPRAAENHEAAHRTLERFERTRLYHRASYPFFPEALAALLVAGTLIATAVMWAQRLEHLVMVCTFAVAFIAGAARLLYRPRKSNLSTPAFARGTHKVAQAFASFARSQALNLLAVGLLGGFTITVVVPVMVLHEYSREGSPNGPMVGAMIAVSFLAFTLLKLLVVVALDGSLSLLKQMKYATFRETLPKEAVLEAYEALDHLRGAGVHIRVPLDEFMQEMATFSTPSPPSGPTRSNDGSGVTRAAPE